MTEAEWFGATEPNSLIDAAASAASPRKLRLFMAGWCRRAWGRYSLATVTRLVEAAERVADLPDGARQLEGIRREYRNGRPTWGVPVEQLLEPRASRLTKAVRGFCTAVGDAGSPFASGAVEQAAWRGSVLRTLATVFRDVVGNPFRSVSFSPEWRTATAVQLAGRMYDLREFGAMPILADALQDAGCETADVLDHCRDPHGVHVRGCWVVDLVLGKS
jgi:hypothetical protein